MLYISERQNHWNPEIIEYEEREYCNQAPHIHVQTWWTVKINPMCHFVSIGILSNLIHKKLNH